MSPSDVPRTVAMTVAAIEICRIVREPASTRENTSRPFVSVPKGWAQLGGWLGTKLLSKIGLYGQTKPGKSAQKIQNPITIAPATTSGERASSRNRSERAARVSDGAGTWGVEAIVLTPHCPAGRAD